MLCFWPAVTAIIRDDRSIRTVSPGWLRSVVTVSPQWWNPCSLCPCRCLFMNWIFLLTTWIMTHSNYVTSSFSSHTDKLRKVVGGLWFLFCFLFLEWHFAVWLLYDFNFAVRFQLLFPLKEGYLFQYSYQSMRNKEPFLWSALSAYYTSLSTSVNLHVSSWVFFLPELFSLCQILSALKLLLFTQFSQLFVPYCDSCIFPLFKPKSIASHSLGTKFFVHKPYFLSCRSISSVVYLLFLAF